MELIDRDALEKEMYKASFGTDDGMQKWDSGLWIRYKLFENAIDNAPTIDAFPVVRCKDCVCRAENKKKRYKYCMFAGWIINDDDFCSHGERLNEVQ